MALQRIFPIQAKIYRMVSKNITKKGHVSKSVYVNKKRKIYSETDEYISDIMIESHYPDCFTDLKHLFIRYFFDDTACY